MKRATLFAVLTAFAVVSMTALTLVPGGVKATTLYVGGGGPGNYTEIQSAIDDALPGGIIYVYNGTYYENLVIDKAMSLIGEDRNATVVNAGGSGDAVHVSAEWVNITGFAFMNAGVSGFDAGVELHQARNCRITGNTISFNGFDGGLLRSSSLNVIAKNIIASNGEMGIFLVSSDNNEILNNTLMTNRAGIFLEFSDNNTLSGNDALNSDHGIFLQYSNHSKVIGNNASRNTNHGITLRYSDNNTVDGNTGSKNGYDGIRVLSSHNNAIAGNTVLRNDVGISLYDSIANTIIDNTASDNEFGLYLWGSTRSYISSNTMVEDGIYVGGVGLEEWNTHAIDTSNTVNGKPVYYWRNVTGGTVPSGAGQVILANCTGVVVDNQNLSNGSIGILLGFSSGNTIDSNIVSSNKHRGIYLVSSSNNTVNANTASGNGNGIYLLSSNGNVVTNNTISGNWDSLWGGITVDRSHENIIDKNIVSRNGNGITLFSSDNNALTGNTITSNHGTGFMNGIGIFLLSMSNNNTMVRNFVFDNTLGIDVWGSDDNMIYHNDFVHNSDSVDGGLGSNQWDDGYPSGGNYWSDYGGVDFFSGPNQDQPGSDSIGDTPYDVGGGNEDRYPLWFPSMTIPPRPPSLLEAYLSGETLENVTITWTLSPDDGDGLRSVAGYEVYRNVTYESDGSGYGLIASLPNGTSVYVDNYRGEGYPSNYFYQVCARDLYSNSSCSSNQAVKFTRPLSQGPSLISIPLIRSNESIETVLQTVKYDRAWYYDSSSREWKWHMKNKEYRRGLWNVNLTIGICVNVTEDSNLTVAGIVPAQTTLHLHEGWNLVSFPSFNASYSISDMKAEIGATRVEGYDLAPPYFLRVLGDAEVLQAGYGYWVEVQADAVWIVEVS